MTTPTPAEVAQHFIKRLGTPAIPCRGKKPLSKWSKPEGRAATHDQVEPLFNRYRAADSVGLVLGGESGLLVVDTDSEAAAHDHERWRLEHGIPETRTHTSPSGKERRHCWYRAPDGLVPPGKGRKDYGDIKATGGYVLAPGLEDGRSVERDTEPVQLTPEQSKALYRLFGGSAQEAPRSTLEDDVAPSTEAADEALLAIPNTEDTDRGQAIGMLLRARTAGCSEGAMLEWLSRYPASDPEEDARMIATLGDNRNAGGYSALLSKAEGLGGRTPTASEREHMLAMDAAHVAEAFGADPDVLPPMETSNSRSVDDRRRDLWTLRELVENPDNLQRGERLSPAGMQHRGELCLIAGLPKIGKSLLCTWDAAMASRDGRRVLWVSYEESLPRIVSRFQQMKADLDMVFVALFPKDLDRVAELITETGAECVWVDSGASYVAQTQGKVPGTEQGELWQGIFGAVQAVAINMDIAITMLVHSPKNAPGEVRGSTGAVAAADAVWKMTGSSSSQRRKVSTIGRWDNAELSFVSDRAENPTGFVMESGFIVMSPAARCFTLVQNNPRCSTRSARNEVSLKHEPVRAELEALETQGCIVNEGTETRHLWIAQPGFRVSQDRQRSINVLEEDISDLEGDSEVAA
jgi:hypothetical protein